MIHALSELTPDGALGLVYGAIASAIAAGSVLGTLGVLLRSASRASE